MRFATVGPDDIAPRHKRESGALPAPAQLARDAPTIAHDPVTFLRAVADWALGTGLFQERPFS